MQTCARGHVTVEHRTEPGAARVCPICGDELVSPRVSVWLDWQALILVGLFGFALLAILCAGLLGLT